MSFCSQGGGGVEWVSVWGGVNPGSCLPRGWYLPVEGVWPGGGCLDNPTRMHSCYFMTLYFLALKKKRFHSSKVSVVIFVENYYPI